ncbi:hypothetical protein Tco_1275439 [Tanacetum coccineum]
MTRLQTQTEMEELIAHVSKKTYAYGAIHAENHNLLITISELKTRLAMFFSWKKVVQIGSCGLLIVVVSKHMRAIDHC